jgi:hypothetical protein
MRTKASRRGATSKQGTSILESVNELVEAVTGLIGSVGRAAAGAAVTLQGATPAKVAAKVAQKSESLRKSLKAHWAKMTPAQRKARVRKMLAGRGLKPKGTTKTSSKGNLAGKARGRRGRGARAGIEVVSG